MYSAARSSASPPISPIITMASVSGSSLNAARASMCVLPMTGSPPMPMQVEKPMSRSSYIIWYVSVPDLLTRPIRPGPVVSAGMMPALDLPGLATPGQFGPTIRVRLPVATAWAQKAAVSCTGIPSVITTASPIPASIASTTAGLVAFGGTKTTLVSAPVSAMASATLAKTGSFVPSKSIFWPALLGLVPPTTVVPAASILRVCLVPSEPVMPCTTTLLDSVSQTATTSHPRLARQFGSAPGRRIHGVDPLDERVRGLVEDLPPPIGVVAVEPDHQWLADGRRTAPGPALGQQVER